jgi:hypothetical protein
MRLNPQHLLQLARDRRGLAMMEFALCLPILLLLCTLGIEYVNYIVTKKRISEIAAQIADNASRMGDATILNNKPVSEAEINDLFVGATLQAGDHLALQSRSRIILSSLERNGSGGQWIHWQRCFGAKSYSSSYGVQGDGATGTSFAGMGPAGSRITASVGTAVMFVEVAHSYKPVIALLPLSMGDIVEIATFNVRDTRDLSQVYPSTGVTTSTCS